MRYHSTRSKGDLKTFDEVLVATYAADGGLYVPEHLPTLDMETLESWKDHSFPQICAEVMHLFTDIDLVALNQMTTKAFGEFNDGYDPLPLRKYDDIYILDTSLGPTMAFKDIGQQMVGQLLNYVLGKKGKKANIIVETSGDTGPAAIAGVRGCKNVNIFCLYPYQRVSDVQELQMVTVHDDNVFVYRTEGNSDLQASVLKELFTDKDFVVRNNVCSVNSINWARIAAQSSYYVWAYLQIRYKLEVGNQHPVDFIIPTGAFGNAMGGYIAKLMGVPMNKIICTTNINDIVHRTLSRGDLRMAENHQTESPAMDIQFAYNLERMLYYVTGQNAELVDDIMTKVERQYQYSQDAEGVLLEPWLVTEMQKVFTSSAVTDEQTLSTIKLFYEKYNFLLCPHSAISVYGALFPFSSLSKEEILVCVLTAHPAKFETAIQKSLGFIPSTVEKVEMMKKIEPKFKWLRISSEDASVWRQEWRDTIIRDVEEVVSR